MNTVGPYHNRQETYAYFSLPFCVGAKQSINHYHETMSEALQGVELEFSGYDIDFKGRCTFSLVHILLHLIFIQLKASRFLSHVECPRSLKMRIQ